MMKIICVPGLLIMIAFLAFPAAGAEYVLDIYGNANMDSTIDDQDLAYAEQIINGSKEITDFADANYDGKIDGKDIEQIQAIIRGDENELVLRDTTDHVVKVKMPLEKVATCSRHFMEVAQSLKISKDVIAGVSQETKDRGYKVLYPSFQDKPTIGCTGNPNADIDCESIIAIKPDLAILYASFNTSEIAQNNLENAKINVIRLNLNRPDITNLFHKEVTKLGYLFNRKEEAKELLDYYDYYENLVQDRLKGLSEANKPKVYYETFTKPYVTVNQFSRVDLTGGENIIASRGFESTMGVMNVDPEEILSKNPDVIIKIAPIAGLQGYGADAENTSSLSAVRDEIMKRPELQNVSAVKNGKVYVISGYVMQSGPFSGCKYFLQDLYQAKWLHPDLFQDIDPKQVHKEYLQKFQGLDIDLDRKGVFVYPEA